MSEEPQPQEQQAHAGRSTEDDVLWWRYCRLVLAGYPNESATRIATATWADLHTAERMLSAGCPPALAESILV